MTYSDLITTARNFDKTAISTRYTPSGIVLDGVVNNSVEFTITPQIVGNEVLSVQVDDFGPIAYRGTSVFTPSEWMKLCS